LTVATSFFWANQKFCGQALRTGIVKAQKAAKIRLLSLFYAQNFRLIPSRTVPTCSQFAAVSSEFPLVTGLSSSTSAIGQPILFGSFFGTTPVSDFSAAFTSGLRPQAFPDRPASLSANGYH
jgi:hypothetical protein